MPKKKKKVSVPLILFGILMVLTVTLCATAAGLYFSGRSDLTSVVIAPDLPSKETITATEEPPAVEEETPAHELLETYTIRHDGKSYQYNQDMYNILLLGIDSDSKPTEALPNGSDIQADVIILAALDLKNNDITLISLNRDIMCNFEILDANGESQGFTYAQLALSYAYGDGLKKSCEQTADAVSSIFYGLQIHNYGVFFMGGVVPLNDALGGITLVAMDDYPFHQTDGYENVIGGQEVTLTGQQAIGYIRCRLETEEGNALRMKRQKQYMLAAFSKAMETIKSNPAYVFTLYDMLDDYILTDLTLSRISYLATKAASMSFTGDIINLTGETALGEGNHMEMTVDQDALYDLMLEVFYEEISE